jgi:hypothetical protein
MPQSKRFDAAVATPQQLKRACVNQQWQESPIPLLFPPTFEGANHRLDLNPDGSDEPRKVLWFGPMKESFSVGHLSSLFFSV